MTVLDRLTALCRHRIPVFNRPKMPDGADDLYFDGHKMFDGADVRYLTDLNRQMALVIYN